LEYYGIEWRELSEEKLLRFPEASKASLKNLGEGKSTTTPTKPPTIEDKDRPLSKEKIDEILQAFKAKFPLAAREGITEESLESWHQTRIKDARHQRRSNRIS
jgi:hypothetical protein